MMMGRPLRFSSLKKNTPYGYSNHKVLTLWSQAPIPLLLLCVPVCPTDRFSSKVWHWQRLDLQDNCDRGHYTGFWITSWHPIKHEDIDVMPHFWGLVLPLSHSWSDICMLRDVGSPGVTCCCHYGSDSVTADVMVWPVASAFVLRPHTYAHIQIYCSRYTHYTQQGQFSWATAVVCSYVLIMIGFVCNYKHSETPHIKELHRIQAYGYPWLLLKNAWCTPFS